MRYAAAVIFLCLAGRAVAQETAHAPPAYDVVSLRLRRGEITLMSGPFIRGRTVTGEALTLRDFVTYAYNLRYDQIFGGPSWAGTDHFDLAAKSDGEGTLPLADSRRMMRTMLEQRFHLKAHTETENAPAYFLTVGKGGPKMKPVDSDAKGGALVRNGEKGMLHLETTRSTMTYLANQLASTAGRPVIDHTSLSGFFAFTLDWFPANRPEPADPDIISMFEAVQQQLGLKIESGRAPFEKLILDSAERPAEN